MDKLTLLISALTILSRDGRYDTPNPFMANAIGLALGELDIGYRHVPRGSGDTIELREL